MKDLEGNEHKLSDFKGSVLLVDFWATWCPPCRMAIPDIIDLYDKYHEQGLVVIGISVDRDIEQLRKFVEDAEIPYIILLANDQTVKKYNVQSIPNLYLFDRQGAILDHHVGYSAEKMAELDSKLENLFKK